MFISVAFGLDLFCVLRINYAEWEVVYSSAFWEEVIRGSAITKCISAYRRKKNKSLKEIHILKAACFER
jgi:hypothetical protein